MGAVIEFVMPKFNFMKIMSKKSNREVEYLSLQYTVSQKGINRWDLYHYPKVDTYTTTYIKDLMNDYEAETKSRQTHEEIADLD